MVDATIITVYRSIIINLLKLFTTMSFFFCLVSLHGD